MPDFATDVYIVMGITLPVATLALVLRLIARRMTRAKYSYDDILAVMSLPGAVAYSTVILIWTIHFGLGRTIADTIEAKGGAMTEKEVIEKSWVMMFCVEVTYTYGIACCKLAILVFYWRLFKFSSIRIPIQVLIGLCCLWLVARVFLICFGCMPIQAFWDLDLRDEKCKLDQSGFFFGTVLTHLIFDILILLLPVIEIWKLHLPFGQKIAVIPLFLFGTLVCVASVIVVIESVRYDTHTTEMPRDMGQNNLWGGIEINLAVISGSLPMLRPIFRKIIPGSFLSSHQTHTGNTQPLSYTNVDNNSRAMKLRQITVARENDESSLISQQTDLEQGQQNLNIYGVEGVSAQTTISSPWDKPPKDGDHGGIHVESETAVRVEKK